MPGRPFSLSLFLLIVALVAGCAAPQAVLESADDASPPADLFVHSVNPQVDDVPLEGVLPM